jgi:hypothetical protein
MRTFIDTSAWRAHRRPLESTDEQLAFAAASFCDRIISNSVWHLPETLETGTAGATIPLSELEHRPEFWRAVTKEATERELRAFRTLEMANDRLAAL